MDGTGKSLTETGSPPDVLERLVRALNERDLDSLLDCFHPDYESEQPVHPERRFRGRRRVSENWSWVFEEFPDFRAELLDYAVQGSDLWTEWRWIGTNSRGQEVDVRGVMILQIEENRFRAGRLYLEPVVAQ